MTKPKPRTRRTCSCGAQFFSGPYAIWCPNCRTQKHLYRLEQHWANRKKYFWTDEKDDYLRGRYDGKVKGRAASIAHVLGWPTWVIKKRAAQLGLCYALDRRDYTAEEERFLVDHAGTRTTHWMAKKLGRTHTSVVLKLKRMKISRRFRDGYTLRELELCFGTDHHVIDRWIREGKLVGRRGTKRLGRGGRSDGVGGGPADPWYFTDEDVLRFIRNHPMEFRLDKIEQLWFMDLVLGGGLLRSESTSGDGFTSLKKKLARRSA